MNKEHKLATKQSQLNFLFNQNNSSYEAKLSLINTAQEPIYFKIISTFGKLLSHQQINEKKLQPLKSLLIQLKLKIPNQIKKYDQKFLVSYSNQQVSSKIRKFDDSILQIKIIFNENIPEEDEVINDILRSDCKQLCEEASELFKKGQIKNALYKYQESFMLFRQLTEGLYGMSQCLYLMQNWNEALQAIQTALIQKQSLIYLWQKIKIVYQILKQQSKDLTLIRSLKKKLLALNFIQNHQQKRKQILNFLENQQNRITLQKGGKLMYEFLQKAIKNYQNSPQIKQIYTNKSLFQKQLHQVLNIKNNHDIQQTPEYIQDPISYEIMNEPFIVPSGHSFQKISLWTYLQKHGNKDLFTRLQTRFQWARPNLALQKFIKNHPNLNKWKQYQKEITTFR